MLGLGWSEMLVIAAVALVVVGPDRLPMVMRQLGRWYGQFRRAADDLRRAFVLEADRQDASDRYKQLQERRKRAQELRKQAEVVAGGSVAQADPTSPAAADPADDPVVPESEAQSAQGKAAPQAAEPDALATEPGERAPDGSVDHGANALQAALVKESA